MKKLLYICMTLMVVCLFTGTALAAATAEKTPRRVAVLPVYDETGSMTEEGLQRLRNRVLRELYVPLNDTLKAV